MLQLRCAATITHLFVGLLDAITAELILASRAAAVVGKCVAVIAAFA